MTTTTTSEPSLTSTYTAPRCVIYARISADAAKLGLGVERQRKACQEKADQLGWDVILVIEENDMSATRGKRPKYRELVSMIDRGEVDIVLCWAQDRLLRKPLEIEALIAIAERNPFTIAGVVDAGTDLSTSSGRHHARMNVANARAEIERKGERMKAENLQRAQMGKPPTVRAFGYHQDGSINEAEAVEVRDAYTRFIAGAGIKTIMTDWNTRGVVNTRGKDWTLYGVSLMLRNPRYISERWLDRRKPGSTKVEPIYIGPGAWEPLVDVDTFRAVQTKLADPARRTNANGPTRKHFGSGLYECGVCADGTKVKAWQEHSRHTTKDGKSHLAVRFLYMCRKHPHLSRKGSDIDEYFMAEIVKFLRHPKNQLAKLMADDRDVRRSRDLRDEEVGLLERVDSLGEEMALKATTGATAAMLVQQMEKAMTRVAARLAEIATEQATLGVRSSLALLEGSADPGLAFLGLPVAEQNKIAGDLGRWVLRRGARGPAKFDSNSVEIEWFHDFREEADILPLQVTA